MNPKNTKKSPIRENADANITCDFGDGDISCLGVAYLTHVIDTSLAATPTRFPSPFVLEYESSKSGKMYVHIYCAAFNLLACSKRLTFHLAECSFQQDYLFTYLHPHQIP